MSISANMLHLPYTCLVTKLRRRKRECQIQMADILKEIINLKNTSQFRTKDEVVQQLRRSKAKMEQLKADLVQDKHEQDYVYDICRKRVHVDREAASRKQPSTKQEMLRQFDKEAVHFFACRNRIKEAKIIQKTLHPDNQLHLFIDLYENAYRIMQAISKNNLRPLKDWVYEHSHYLAKMKSSLQFKLISCGFINILNNTGGTKAIEFIRKEVATLTLNEQDKEDLNRMVFAVLTDENQDQYQYYSDSDQERQRRQQLVAEEQPAEKPVIYVPDMADPNHKMQSESSSSHESIPDVFALSSLLIEQQTQRLLEILPIGEFNAMEQPSEPIRPQQPPLQEQCYEDEFEQMSEESVPGEEHKLEEDEGKFRQILEFEQQKVKQLYKKLQSESNQDQGKNLLGGGLRSQEESVKKIPRKHRLDRNNLRATLNETKQLFISTFSKIYQLSFNSVLDKTVGIGISVLKTHNCGDKFYKREDCPTCSPEVSVLARKIPPTQRNQSAIICRISGKVMDAANYPVMLPNGQIYSVEGLKRTEKHGKYYCMCDCRWFRKEDCRKIFLT